MKKSKKEIYNFEVTVDREREIISFEIKKNFKGEKSLATVIGLLELFKNNLINKVLCKKEKDASKK